MIADGQGSGAGADRPAPAVSVAAAGLVFLCCQFLLGDLRTGHLAPGILDADSYARLLRVESLLAGGGWYDNSLTWSNAPYGDVLHWTRLYDVLVAAGAIPLAQVMDLRTAVWTAGSALPVVLGLAAMVAVAWGSRRRLGAGSVVLLGLLAGIQRTLPMTFKWSSVDHHALILLLFAVGWAGTVRLLGGETRRGALVTGVAAGLAVWVSVESLAWIVALAATLCLLWNWEGEDAHARGLTTLLATATVTALLALVLERPPGEWPVVETDRISVAHVALLAAFAIAWVAVSKRLLAWASAGVGRRLAVSAAACALPGMAVLAAFPKLLKGPVADVDPQVIPLLFDFNGEFTPFHAGDLVYLAMFVVAAGPVIVAALIGVLRLRQADEVERRVTLLTVVLVLVFLPLTLIQWRWVRYLDVAALLPWALAIRWVWRWKVDAGAGWYRGLRVPAALALTVGYLVVAVGLAWMNLALARSAPRATPRASSVPASTSVPDQLSFNPYPCSYRGLGPGLAAAAGRTAGELVVMSTMFEGPQLVWESGVRVVGTPYHRNAAGILDTDRVMARTDEDAAQSVLEERGVDFVVLCRTGHSVALLAQTAPEGLAARLARGEVPAWLEPVAISAAVDRSLRVFRVR